MSHRDDFRWRATMALALVAALLALLAPLGDPDLPEHLSVGEWIVRHGGWPRVEPFAWTRAGAPYFAYSWLAQVTYYGALALAGPVGLHLLQAVIGAAAVLTAAAFARGRGWGEGAAAALGALNYAAMAAVANQLRPEQLLFVLVPLAWVLADAMAGAMPGAARGRTAGLLGAHLALGCAAANVHLFFPLTAAPLGLKLLGGGEGGARRTRRLLASGLALAAGWLISPYGLLWPAVFRLNFHPNVLLRRPPIIGEMEPGFEAALGVGGAAVLALLLLALPWVRPQPRRPLREVAVEALAWGGGLVLFAFAYRLIALWWLLSLPAVGVRLRAVAAALEGRRRARRAAVLALVGVMAITMAPPWPSELRLEGGVRARTLPGATAAAARPLADLLVCRTGPEARGRVLTSFNYGSYLTWRLPGYSVSIDGRTIFPDSVAREFGWAQGGRRDRHARTWDSAQLALLPRWLAVNDALAADPAWLRLAFTGPPDGKRGSGGGAALWVRRDWWRTAHSPAPARSPSCMAPARKAG